MAKKKKQQQEQKPTPGALARRALDACCDLGEAVGSPTARHAREALKVGDRLAVAVRGALRALDEDTDDDDDEKS